MHAQGSDLADNSSTYCHSSEGVMGSCLFSPELSLRMINHPYVVIIYGENPVCGVKLLTEAREVSLNVTQGHNL